MATRRVHTVRVIGDGDGEARFARGFGDVDEDAVLDRLGAAVKAWSTGPNAVAIPGSGMAGFLFGEGDGGDGCGLGGTRSGRSARLRGEPPPRNWMSSVLVEAAPPGQWVVEQGGEPSSTAMSSPSTVTVTVRSRGINQWISVQTACAMAAFCASSAGDGGGAVAGAGVEGA